MCTSLPLSSVVAIYFMSIHPHPTTESNIFCSQYAPCTHHVRTITLLLPQVFWDKMSVSSSTQSERLEWILYHPNRICQDFNSLKNYIFLDVKECREWPCASLPYTRKVVCVNHHAFYGLLASSYWMITQTSTVWFVWFYFIVTLQ